MTLSLLLGLALMAGIMTSIEIGYRFGSWQRVRAPERVRTIPGTIEGSVFGLMGLLIAFIFSGAATRFEARRQLMVVEANVIGTAYLRVDLLPAQAQPKLREDFREYVRARLAIYNKISGLVQTNQIPDVEMLAPDIDRLVHLQKRLWRDMTMASWSMTPAVQVLLLSSVNQVIDMATPQMVALKTHLPSLVFAMLFLTVISSALLAGYKMALTGPRDWITVIAFVVVLSAALYVIIDYEFPRAGAIRIDSLDTILSRTVDGLN